MANFFDDNADLQFYLGPGLDWDTLAWVTELGYSHPEGFRDGEQARTFYGEVVSQVGAFAADEVAPHTAEIDREAVRFRDGEVTFPPRLASIFTKMAALDLFALTLPRELGGTNAPLLVYFINGEMLARADVSVMAHHGFHGGIAMAMLALSLIEGSTAFDRTTGRLLRTRWEREIREIGGGQAWGSMDITEPDAGSDMAALRATGTQQPDGTWRLRGQKIFITSGHGKYHFVIARTVLADGRPVASEGGLKNLSMFLVPAYEDLPDGNRRRLASLDRIEEKLGHHGSATAALTFDDTPAQLVGKPGDGFRLMLEVMNHARLGVGFEAIGLCEAALRLARGYAAERRSMGKTIDRHEMIADYLEQMEIDIVGLRALAMHAAFHEEVGHKLELFGATLPPGKAAAMSSDPRSRQGIEADPVARARDHRAKARRALPLLKYLGAEKAVEMARLCLQIHGGNGYMREFGAEKLLRDALVLPIYEGTSQIQALMATKDTLMAIIKRPHLFMKDLAEARWRSLTTRDARARRVAQLDYLSLSAQQHLVRKLLGSKLKAARGKPLRSWRAAIMGRWDPRTDFSYALLHAERLTRLLADVEISHVLLEQSRNHPERAPLLDRFLARAEPRARYLHDEIKNTGGALLERLRESDVSERAPLQDGDRPLGAVPPMAPLDDARGGSVRG